MDLIAYLTNPNFVFQVSAAVLIFGAVVIFLAWSDHRARTTQRLRQLTDHREALFEKQRQELQRRYQRVSHKSIYAKFIEKFNLKSLIENEDIQLLCARAGLRGNKYPMIYVFFTVILPIICFFISMVYLFSIMKTSHTPFMKVVLSGIVGVVGGYLPKILLINKMNKRYTELAKAYPDMLDLLIICVEAGMSLEASFNKVAEEIGKQSMVLAEEIGLTTAELSFLSDRRQAYDNLSKRINLQPFRSLTTALIQSEKYGTPLGQSLRVLSQEQREIMSQAIEKKAASLPAKLTVPMIVFFLPALFVVIIGPAALSLMHMK